MPSGTRGAYYPFPAIIFVIVSALATAALHEALAGSATRRAPACWWFAVMSAIFPPSRCHLIVLFATQFGHSDQRHGPLHYKQPAGHCTPADEHHPHARQRCRQHNPGIRGSNLSPGQVMNDPRALLKPSVMHTRLYSWHNSSGSSSIHPVTGQLSAPALVHSLERFPRPAQGLECSALTQCAAAPQAACATGPAAPEPAVPCGILYVRAHPHIPAGKGLHPGQGAAWVWRQCILSSSAAPREPAAAAADLGSGCADRVDWRQRIS